MINIRKSFLAAAIATIAVATPLTAAQAATGDYFTLINSNASVSIKAVYTKPSRTTFDWAAATGTWVSPRATSTFTMASRYCYQDIVVRFTDGVEQTFREVNICTGDAIRAY